MTEAASARPQAWSDAALAAALISIDPRGLGGIRVRARAGPVRDMFLDQLGACVAPAMQVHRVAAGVPDARLTGGLDVGLTLERGLPVVETGVLAQADGGMLIVAMAERLAASTAGIIAACMDDGCVRIERDGLSLRQPARFALIALDEGIDQEAPPAALVDRMGLVVDIDAVGLREATFEPLPDLSGARSALAHVAMPDKFAELLVSAAMECGAGSLRSGIFLCRAARALAALRGAATVELEDLVVALRLVLRVRIAPQDEEAKSPPPEPDHATSSGSDAEDASPPEPAADMIIEAIRASVPEGLLETGSKRGTRRRQTGEGRSGEPRRAAERGRAVGVTDRPPAPGSRIDVLATLRQAAPWQRIRRAARQQSGLTGPQPGLLLSKQDFRYVRHKEKAGTTAIFAVDASGSAAYERLAETKGAVETLLAECYVRRDSVAMIAFRGTGAEILLEPTRSLLRARRCLTALPGGGGTPLAAGVLATLLMGQAAERRGQDVVAVFLTDGRGNVALDGTSGRERVADDTDAAARRFRRSGLRAILIDTARRPQARATALAENLGAEYVALPFGNASTIAREIGDRMEA